MPEHGLLWTDVLAQLYNKEIMTILDRLIRMRIQRNSEVL